MLGGHGPPQDLGHGANAAPLPGQTGECLAVFRLALAIPLACCAVSLRTSSVAGAALQTPAPCIQTRAKCYQQSPIAAKPPLA